MELSWLRGNDSVRGLENLRLAQYTVQQYFTLVTRSPQETGNRSSKRASSPLFSFGTRKLSWVGGSGSQAEGLYLPTPRTGDEQHQVPGWSLGGHRAPESGFS